MTVRLRIGFIPLVDAALLVAAREEGFAEEEGIAIDLVREASWANIRDKLSVGLFDAAHMLAPAAIASSLGIGHVRVPLTVPMSLNLNGNAITVSLALYEDLAAAGQDLRDPKASAAALASVVARRRAAGAEPLTFGTVFPFSMHTYQLRIWFAAAGLRLDDDVRVMVVPPPYMASSLAEGLIDGFCVGAPWSLKAFKSGAGIILHAGVQIVANGPEKVLALPRMALPAPEVIASLVRALLKASAWSAKTDNRARLAGHMAQPGIMDMPAELIADVLAGHITLGRGESAAGAVFQQADYLRLDPGALRPTVEQASFILDQMRAAGHATPEEAEPEAAWGIYDSRILDEAAAALGMDQVAPPAAPIPLL